MNILIVDGYNIIGAWPDLRKLKQENLAAARDLLIERMADYQGYTGYKVIVVFDAHYVKGTEKKYRNYKVEVIFTRENESADERIEKMAIELTTIKNQVYVATSDYTEQWQVFGQGALRVSARELLTEIEIVEQKIKRNINKIKEEKFHTKISLNDEVAEIFEKWRRGDR
ncbi:putative RNA-binding protein with PIN domain [Oikeobacillus pervagus]|uniref:RNA-binding protein with PIN domain n=1 Tax=Oikeobacillus pervagus TaxID=1325931 RepID=A0AAJ1SZF6_9BACI|nr:NYN domain-containing protein [Oikeobacillus pervagus]MDQ0215693.1 putative RNA-binding protein with PIN domain [Oikeobacillus pervagus]